MGYRIQTFSFIVIYWILSVNLYVVVRYLGNEVHPMPGIFGGLDFSALQFVFSSLGGLLFGAFNGFVQVVVYPKYIRKRSFGISILLKSLIFLVLVVMIIMLVSSLIRAIGFASVYDTWGSTFGYFFTTSFLSIVIYTIVMSGFLDLILQVNRRMGPGSLRSLMNGKYFHPKEEERIFMFLDLKSSTAIAEKLGHVQFSSLLQDCYQELSNVLLKYKASVYQYVGDEVVLTWEYALGLERLNCFQIYFEFDQQISNSNYYLQKYGVQPKFSASINAGQVTVAEVGDIKSELAFHGDVLNTAARVQKLCKVYDEEVLVVNLFDECQSERFELVPLDKVKLEGRNNPVEVYALHQNRS